MKINVSLPFDKIQYPHEFLRADAIAEIPRTAEHAGFNAGCDTDHPVPTGTLARCRRPPRAGPVRHLTFVAAATRTLRLQTGIFVLPYRHPFITARAVATLDYVSGGRVTLGIGAGYLKGEYKALGVDFERRNEIMDEYLEAMKAAWSADEFTFQGTGYQALGNRILPRPIQQPHPPLLIGGNSRRAIRRAVELGDGWNPFITSAAVSATTRTAAMTDEMDLAAGIAYLREHCEKVGRTQLPEIVVGAVNQPNEAWNAQALLEKIAKMRELGVSTVERPSTAAAAPSGARTRSATAPRSLRSCRDREPRRGEASLGTPRAAARARVPQDLVGERDLELRPAHPRCGCGVGNDAPHLITRHGRPGADRADGAADAGIRAGRRDRRHVRPAQDRARRAGIRHPLCGHAHDACARRTHDSVDAARFLLAHRRGRRSL